MKTLHIHVDSAARVNFHNNAAQCIGTGRMGLALQQEYQEQLAMAQSECGFKQIRGHGLFSDDMAIYQPWTDENGIVHDAYNFTYLDRVMDAYLKQGLQPFLELGFMPEKMASGSQTIFYWKGNTTPPADQTRWANLIKATLNHLADRYGRDIVSTWNCEVWNEPNLPGFWENADEEKYHQLYAVSARAVKEVLPDMPVGGPAVCGGSTTPNWIRNFLTFCRDEHLPLDFVSRHAYMGEGPEHHGRYLYHTMRSVESLVEEMQGTREIIDSFPEFRGMPMHITEFNTSYNPFCPIHDTNLNAAYIAGLLSRLGDMAASYSYWTFGDVFEEQGVPPRLFHGGFGLIANGLIAKPTLWTFAFFNHLKGDCVYRDAHVLLTRQADGTYQGIAWNICREDREALSLTLEIPSASQMALTVETVDETVCNPLKVWHDLGEPSSLTKAQEHLLRQAGTPEVTSSRVLPVDGTLKIALTLGQNAVTRFTLSEIREMPDRGYDYSWYCTHA